jgi:RhtB (resistance to homoserine/threonine) family protein
VTAGLTSGNADFSGIDGNLDFQSTSGSLEANNVTGELNVGLTSGNAKLDNIGKLGSIRFTSGNIRASNAGLGENTQLSGSSGNFTIQTPSNLKAFNFSLKASSGNLKVGGINSGKALEIDNGSNSLVKGNITSGNITTAWLPWAAGRASGAKRRWDPPEVGEQVAVISPGADFALVTRNSLLLSRRAGVLTALGIGLGVLVHVGYTLLGAGLLLRQSAWLFDALKLAGAAYLVYLGIGMLLNKAAGTQHEAQAPLTDHAALRTGLLTNALNPKTAVFIVSLFMQVIEPDTGLATQLVYGAFIALAHLGWFTLVALCFSAGHVRQRLLAARHWIDRLFGGLLVGFGVLLALAAQGQ